MCGGHPENLTPAVLSDRAAGSLWGKSASLTRRVALPAGTALSATPLPVAVGTPSSTTCTAGAQSACSSRPRPASSGAGAFPDAARSASSLAVKASSIRCISLCSVICCCSRRTCAPWSSSMSVAAMASAESLLRPAVLLRGAANPCARFVRLCLAESECPRTPARLELPPSLSRSLNSQPVCVVAQRTRHGPRTLLLGWMPAPPDSGPHIHSHSGSLQWPECNMECKCRKAAKPSAQNLVNFAWAGSVDSRPHVWFCAIERLSRA